MFQKLKNYRTFGHSVCGLLLALSLQGCQTLGGQKAEAGASESGRLVRANLSPKDIRGGTTKGASVEYDQEGGKKYFEAIQNAKTQKEKDRQAILAQVGDYKVSFEFLETFAFDKTKELAKPYYSWTTEYIFPLEEKENFISLQHILVMSMVDEKGKVLDPIVVKHWRQDWTYQPKDMLNYMGYKTWKKEKLSSAQSRGAWLQAVYQVDDSPRYNALGKWTHTKDFSVWSAAPTPRPLPRREHTVRSDYQVLNSMNRVTITPTGWYHEQDNTKVVVDEKTLKPVSYIAREVGFNTYDRIKNFDFSAGKKYWKKTAPYWTDVRQHWDEVIGKKNTLKIHSKVDGKPLYKHHFGFADQIMNPSKDDKTAVKPSAYKTHAVKTIDSFVR